MEEYEKIELRSDDVQEILGTPPSWLVRWGTTIIFFTVGAMLLSAWWIKYPDMIEARVIISTAVPPVEVIARTDGRIANILKQDNSAVNAGDVVIVLQSTADYRDVIRLDSLVNKLQRTQLESFLFSDIPSALNVGELQGDYSIFRQHLKEFEFSTTDRTASSEQRVRKLQEQKSNLQKRTKVNEAVRKKAKQELELEEQSYEQQKKLYASGLISLAELQNHNRKLVAAQREFESLRGNDIEIQNEINNIDKYINETTFSTKEGEANIAIKLRESLNNLRSSVDKWKQTFLLIAPISGSVSFNSTFYSEQQHVKQDNQVFAIAPKEGKEIEGRVNLPVLGSGKVKTGQKVIIRLDSYPSEEFGTIEGRVESKSTIPKDGQYTIQLSLPYRLKSSRNKDLQFEQQLQGTAQIITDERRFLTRFFDRLFEGMN